METSVWPTKRLSVTSLYLDTKNPRLGPEGSGRAPQDIIQFLFEHDKAMEVAESIALRGYFPNEPLLAIKERDRYVVVEGNRRLAALKALREPEVIIEDSLRRRVDALSRRMEDLESIVTVPVTIAPNRRATDRQLAGRHIGTPVRAWQAENRASFILNKLAEGYDNDSLRDELGFTLADIQQARQTRAIADTVRSLELPDDVKAKLTKPRAKILTTLERLFDSSVGREYLQVEPDPEHGFRGKTTKKEFLRVFARVVTDIAREKASSRTLNTNDDIKNYFESWEPEDRPAKKQGSFVPSDIAAGTVASPPRSSTQPPKTARQQKPELKTVLPRDLKIRCNNTRLIDIRRELTKLKRDDFPNASAVLLRVFFELTVVDYLRRTGELAQIADRLAKKNVKLPHGAPTMKQLVPEIVRIAKARLQKDEAAQIEKAVRYDQSAPFTISELHGFVHSSDIPSPRDTLQFWIRTEPLFRLMLERDEDPNA